MSPDMIVESIINKIEGRPSTRLRRRRYMISEAAAPSKFYKVNQGWVSKEEAEHIRDEYIAKLKADGEDVPFGRVYIGRNAAGLMQVVDKYKNQAGEMISEMAAPSKFYKVNQGWVSKDEAKRIRDEYIAKLRADGEDVPSGRVYIGGNSAGLKQVVDKYKNPAGEFVGGDASSAASNFTNYKQGAADRKAARIADGTYGQRTGRKMGVAPAVIDQADKGVANKAIKVAYNALTTAVENGEEIDEIDLFSDNKEQNIIEWFEAEVVSSVGKVSSNKTAISNYVDGIINGSTAIKKVIGDYIEAFGL